MSNQYREGWFNRGPPELEPRLFKEKIYVRKPEAKPEEPSEIIISGGGSMAMFEHRNLDWISTTVDPIVVLDKWYTPLPTTRNVKAWYLFVEQTNNGATAEDIEIELTLNGIALPTDTRASVSGTPYAVRIRNENDPFMDAGNWTLGAQDSDQSVPLETRSLQVRVRQTTAVDVVAANIEVNMVYATKEWS